MRSRDDPGADALDVRLAQAPAAESEELRPCLVVNLDEEGRIVGLETLGAGQRLAAGADYRSSRRPDRRSVPRP